MLTHVIIFLITITLIKSNMRRAYKFSVILFGATLFNIGIYVFLVELLEEMWSAWGISKSAEFLRSLRYVFFALAAAELVLIKAFRRFMIRKWHPKERTASKIADLLLSIEFVTFALCEAIVLYGLIYFFVSGDTATFYIFLVLGLTALGIHYPRYSDWEEVVNSKGVEQMVPT